MSDKTLCLLTDDELVALDGRCRDEIQAKVMDAKVRVTAAASVQTDDRSIALFIGALVQEATTNGRLVFQHTGIERCPVCDRHAGYARHKRGGRHHRKGDENRARPLAIGAYEFARRFFSVSRHVALGCCDACWAKASPLAAKALAEVRAAIPEGVTGRPPRFVRYDNRKCQCGWEGHEGQMEKRRTLMGDGWYPAVCPKCRAENGLFNNPVKSADGFVIEDISP